ncbi:hypothetical protein CCH79_00010881 [Gambusia affinis]|uniref:Isochorismatase-like domain-containing protein n=1 Tax=Gambusia affinis TaxID=33528 RepID=A0A315VN61_GAMAF|nr:hypothetical protein CCH79_00010881 [Gambusia affinis]
MDRERRDRRSSMATRRRREAGEVGQRQVDTTQRNLRQKVHPHQLFIGIKFEEARNELSEGLYRPPPFHCPLLSFHYRSVSHSLQQHIDCKMANIGRLSTKDAVLFLCDMQEKFRPNIFQFTNIVSNAARVLQSFVSSNLELLLQASRILGIPAILTEQYPKGLGPTVPELGAGDLTPHAKTSFTMFIEEVEKELKALGSPKQAILCGIEAHACIACTTYDLIEKGMEVHIVADAVSSRSQTDRLFALSRMKQSGAYLTTTEAVLLQLVQDAKHPNFKEIQRLLVQPSPDTGLLAFFSAL